MIIHAVWAVKESLMVALLICCGDWPLGGRIPYLQVQLAVDEGYTPRFHQQWKINFWGNAVKVYIVFHVLPSLQGIGNRTHTEDSTVRLCHPAEGFCSRKCVCMEIRIHQIHIHVPQGR